MKLLLNQIQTLALIEVVRILNECAVTYCYNKDNESMKYDAAILFHDDLLSNMIFSDDGKINVNLTYPDATHDDYELYWSIIFRSEVMMYSGNRVAGISLNEIHNHYKTEWLNYDSPEVLNEDGFHRDPSKFKGLKISWSINLNEVYIQPCRYKYKSIIENGDKNETS